MPGHRDVIRHLGIRPAHTADAVLLLATVSSPLVNRDLFGINF
jgi:hypothetical protein